MTNQHVDSFGSATTSPLAALSGINDFCEGFLSYQPRAVNILETADHNPDSALANIYAGILWMFLERPEAPLKSIPYSQRAESNGALNDREKGLLAMLKAWQQYDYITVRAIADTLTDTYPQDLSLLKIAQYHAFNAGDSAHMLALAKKNLERNAHLAPMHSMLAFAYEQSNDLENAERAGHKALDIDVAEPWAHHALAHVHLGRGTINEGLKFLSDYAYCWKDLNSFMFTHNWWHVALFEIARGDVGNALKIYDERCWGVQPEYSQDQIGAVSLLARLEFAGMDVGDRWQQLRPFLETREDDVVQPFLSLQYLYGLARAASPKTDTLLSLIRQQAVDPQVPGDATLWKEVGVDLAEAIVAHATQHYVRAADLIAPLRKQIWRIGGSHAQRDLFEQLLLDARLRSGQWDLARKTLEHRRQWEPDSPILESRLRDVYQHLNR
ncbi:MAG: hypothetical protein AB8B87_25805 [Granulosicoccus sp.]